MLTLDQLREMLSEFRQMPSEMEWLEFKEAKTSFSFDELGRYFSAMSNEANLKHRHSAWVIFGIKDKLPREIVGTRFRLELGGLESLKHEVAQQANGITFQEIYELNFLEGRVLMFQIPAAPAGIPTSWKGHFYGRDGQSLAPLSIHELESIRNQIGHVDWSAEVCRGATFGDLDSEALRIARQQFSDKHRQARFGDDIEAWDTPTFLEKAKLTRNGQLTRTAILLLGKPEAGHHLTPHPAQITWRLHAEEEAYEHFAPPFLLSVEEVFRRIRNIKFRIQPFNQLIPVELIKYDAELRRRKLIEGRYPNLYISASVAKTTGQKAEYTKHRAFDNQYYKDLIIRFLEQHRQGNSEDFRKLLLDKLSDALTDRQKRDKVRNLLQELVREGRIVNLGGRGLGALWALRKDS